MRLRFALYPAGLLLLFAVSALPGHAQCLTTGTSNTPYLVFGPQSIGATSLAQTAILTFSTTCATTTVTISGTINTTGTNPGDFLAPDNAGTCPGTALIVTSDSPATCTLRETFAPTALGTRTAAAALNWTTPNSTNGTTAVNLIGGDEIVYVTTGVGGQVLTVDTTTPNVFEVLSNAPQLCDGPCAFNPTGAVVGPDAKIYMTDSFNSAIWRMNQDGSQLEAVFQASGCPAAGPCNPEGPSFSASGNGDLYCNTFKGEDQDGLFFIQGAAALTNPFPGTFNSPVNVEPGTCDGCGSNGFPAAGTGTAFDANGNLLAADQETSKIWSLAPPYDASVSAPAAILTSSTTVDGVSSSVVGIALNKANGQTYFVESEEVVQIVPPVNSGPYTTTPYSPFTTTNSGCEDDDVPEPDLPEYIAFDMTSHMFGTTSTSPLNINVSPAQNGCGRVWRINPGASPTPALLLDLYAAYTNGITVGDTVICLAPCGLNSTQAIGLAMPPTTGPTQSIPLNPNGGTYSAGLPVGCTPTPLPPNDCRVAIFGVYPAGIYSSGDTMNITISEMSQRQFKDHVGPASPYFTNTLAPVAGWNGNGYDPSLVCLNGSGMPCNDAVTPGTSYQMFDTWQSTQTAYCTLIPHKLRGDPVGGLPYATLFDTIVGCTDGGVGTKGRSSCSSSSSSSCASDWLDSFGPVTGSTAGVTATTTITAPTNGASFLLNQPATATFACGQTPSSPSIMVTCGGIVTNPAFPNKVISVASGGPLPTSLAGTNTLSVTAQVSGGSPGPGATAQYTVVPCQDVSLAFNPSTVAVGKFTTVMSTFQSCNSKTELAVIQFNLTGPLGKSCGILTTPEFSVPAILSTKPVSFSFPLRIPNGACAGTYTVSSNTYVKGTLVSVTTSSLMVTAH